MSRVVYVIDGRNIRSINEFCVAAGEAVGGPGHYFGGNLDGLNDCLSGGFGTPDDGDFEFVITSADTLRETLGYSATLAWRESRPHTRGTPNGNWHADRVDDACSGRGQTLFDISLEIFSDQNVTLTLK